MTEFEFTKDGLPLHTVDLPTVHYEGDLAVSVGTHGGTASH
jgi:hypothetical protein